MTGILLVFASFLLYFSECYPLHQEVNDDVRFLLWTRENDDIYQELKMDESIQYSNFNPKKPTKFLTHGYNDHGTTHWVLNVKDQYLIKEDCNVISLDWEKLAKGPDYFKAVKNSKKVGLFAGDFLLYLMEETGLSKKDLHVIGFSLGAQLVGVLGYRLNGTLPRITGLDPAGPLFHTAPLENKLDPSDARFVDVIHAAGLWIGTDEPLGHIDFYPNSGKAPQPGCTISIGLDCSHNRAPEYFSESINSEYGFEAVKCDSWNHYTAGDCDENSTKTLMGEPVDPELRGLFYLRTNSNPPFAKPPSYLSFIINEIWNVFL